MSLGSWLGFLVAAMLVAISPGPGAVLSMSIGMRYGYRQALVAILGLQAALLLQVLVVAVGLGALLATSDAAFAAVKFLGVLYLVWLGVQKWRALPMPPRIDAPLPANQGLFTQGLLVNLTNPKAIVFIGALVPQFVDPGQPTFVQYLILGVTLCITDIVVMSAYALAALRLGGWLNDPRSLLWQNRIFGGIFCAAGAVLAASSRAP